jgi:hypothetical protein
MALILGRENIPRNSTLQKEILSLMGKEGEHANL